MCPENEAIVKHCLNEFIQQAAAALIAEKRRADRDPVLPVPEYNRATGQWRIKNV